MAASKYKSIDRTSINNLSGDYISANSRQGGSYYSNYHKQLPKILIGNARTGARDIYVSCENIYKGETISVAGYIENEYLLENIKIYYKIGYDDFKLIERDPYAEWVFELNAITIYTSNLQQIELKLEGVDLQGKTQTYIETYNIVIQQNCMLDIDCKGSLTESVVDLQNISSVGEVFMITVNDEVFYAESLTALQNILRQKNIEFEVYTKTLN